MAQTIENSTQVNVNLGSDCVNTCKIYGVKYICV